MDLVDFIAGARPPATRRRSLKQSCGLLRRTTGPGYPFLSYQASNSSRDTFSCRSIRPRKSRLIEKGCLA